MKTSVYDTIARHIAQQDRAVISVLDGKPFSYSIGNALRGLPELLVIGLSPNDATALINEWSNRMIEHRPFLDGELVDIGGRFPAMAVDCADHVRSEYTIQAGQYLEREDYAVIQMIVPDRSGRFPGDPACEAPFRDIPVLRASRVLQ